MKESEDLSESSNVVDEDVNIQDRLIYIEFNDELFTDLLQTRMLKIINNQLCEQMHNNMWQRVDLFIKIKNSKNFKASDKIRISDILKDVYV